MRGPRPPSGGQEIGKKGGVVRTRRTNFWTKSAEGGPPSTRPASSRTATSACRHLSGPPPHQSRHLRP
eukprot:359883-Chlamydomonas_euryale.AAC.1